MNINTVKKTLVIGLLVAMSPIILSSPSVAAKTKENNASVAACFGQLRATSNDAAERSTLKGLNAEQNRQDKEDCRAPEPSVNGGYPDDLAASPYISTVDPWGYYNRTSPSYAAFKVHQSTGYGPYYYGNANNWPASAMAAGKTVSTTPSAHSVGVIMAGAYGHVVWVERVNSDGTLDISQYDYYNAGGSGSGHYSEMRVPSSMYNYYISF